MQLSKFHFYSIGYAVNNKATNSSVIEVFPAEVTSYADGELVSDPEYTSVSGTNAFGEEYTVKAKTTLSIKATWLMIDGNRISAPDIRRGERVILYRMADSDKYYWQSIPREGEFLRRLETVVWAFSNLEDESKAKIGIDNSVIIEVSTHNRTVTIMTPTNRGEPTPLKIQLNYKEGSFHIVDGSDQSFNFESKLRQWLIQNADGSSFEINKTKINMKGIEEFNIDTKRFKLNATESVTVSTKTTTYTGTTTTFNVPTTNFTGAVNVTGLFTFTGGIAGSATTGADGGGATLNLNIALGGGFTIKHGNISIGKGHRHMLTDLTKTDEVSQSLST